MGVFVAFPIARLAGRAALIGAIITGGLLAAGIAQAQAQTLPSPAAQADPSAAPSSSGDTAGQPTAADRQAELIAATGGPAPAQHLMAVAPERPAVEARADDVEALAPDPADALNAAEAARGQPSEPSAPETAPPAAPADPTPPR